VPPVCRSHGCSARPPAAEPRAIPLDLPDAWQRRLPVSAHAVAFPSLSVDQRPMFTEPFGGGASPTVKRGRSLTRCCREAGMETNLDLTRVNAQSLLGGAFLCRAAVQAGGQTVQSGASPFIS